MNDGNDGGDGGPAPDHARRSPLDVLLGLFTEVRAGEGVTAVLLALTVFLLLTAYYIIKPVREALILAGGGAALKSYLSAGIAVLLVGAVPLYSRLASRYPRRRLINVVTGFFMICLVAFYLAAAAGIPLLVLGVVFFLWVGIFNMMVVAQFWSFANDVYTPEEGKRLFAIVAFGASAGAVAGSRIAGELIAPLGVNQLLLVSCVVLGASLLLTNAVDARQRRRRPARRAGGVPDDAVPDDAERALTGASGFPLVWRSRYLLLIAFMMLVANWVNTTGEFILGRMVTEGADAAVAAGEIAEAGRQAWIGGFWADFFFGVNLAALAIQLFLVSRILKYLGVRVALVMLPAIALGGYTLMAALPLLRIVRWSKTAENATDYSLQNTVRNVLFLPTSRDEKYKAKQAIDTFFVRAGDVLSAGLVFAGTAWLGLSVQGFALANVVLAAAWIALAIAIGRLHRQLTGRGDEEGAG